MANNEARTREQSAYALLTALRAAGSVVWIEPEPDGDGDQLITSPPLQHVDWAGDVEAAIEDLYYELKALVRASGRRRDGSVKRGV